MTKKDYIAIAAVIAEQRMLGPLRTDEDRACNRSVQAVLDLTARSLADCMQRDNPRFDRATFLAACNVL